MSENRSYPAMMHAVFLDKPIGQLVMREVKTPQPRELGTMIDVLPAGSSVIIYGNLTRAEQIMVNPRSLIDKDITISGFYLGSRSKKNGLIKNIINLRKVGKLMSAELSIKIQSRLPLKSAQEAVDTYLANMSAGKVLLLP